MPKPLLRKIKSGQAYRFTLPDDLAELLNRRSEKLGILPKKLFVIALYDYFARNPELRSPFDDVQSLVENIFPAERVSNFFDTIDATVANTQKKGGVKNASK